MAKVKIGLSTKESHHFSVGDYIFGADGIMKVLEVKSKKSAVVRPAYKIEYLYFGLKFLVVSMKGKIKDVFKQKSQLVSTGSREVKAIPQAEFEKKYPHLVNTVRREALIRSVK